MGTSSGPVACSVLPPRLSASPELQDPAWHRVLRHVRLPVYAKACGWCGVEVPVGDMSGRLCDQDACRWVVCIACLPDASSAIRCPAHTTDPAGRNPPTSWGATLQRPCWVPQWAPGWLAWPGRPQAMSVEGIGRLRRACTSTPEVAAVLLPASAAGEEHRRRQRALTWGLQAYVVAAGRSSPSSEDVWAYMRDRAASDPTGSTRLSWWFSLLPLLPADVHVDTASFVREVTVAAGLRQPLVAREGLRPLGEAIAEARRQGTDSLPAAQLLLAAAALRGGCRFASAVDVAMGAWISPPQQGANAVVVTPRASKSDQERAAVPLPVLIPLPMQGVTEALRRVTTAAAALGEESHAQYLRRWRAVHLMIRGALRRHGVDDVRGPRREVAALADMAHGRTAAEQVLGHRPGSAATVRYTTRAAASARTVGVLSDCLKQ